MPRLGTINLDMARTFAAICETGNFRMAASQVNRSPSAVSLQVSKLEDLLECELLYRDARRVVLTENGEQFLNYARRLLSLNDEALSKFRGAKISGSLRLAAPFDLGMGVVPGLLSRFATTHPNIRVDVRLDTSETIQSFFMANDADVALFSEDISRIESAKPLYTEKLRWLQAAGSDVANKRPLPLAVAGAGCSWRRAALAVLDQEDVAYRIAYSSDTSAGQLAAVQAGLAVAALPKTLAQGDVIEVPDTTSLPPIGNLSVFLAQKDNELAQVFAEYAHERLLGSATRT